MSWTVITGYGLAGDCGHIFGAKCARLSVAVRYRYRGETITIWFQLIGWGETAVRMLSVARGDRVAFTGRLEMRKSTRTPSGLAFRVLTVMLETEKQSIKPDNKRKCGQPLQVAQKKEERSNGHDHHNQ